MQRYHNRREAFNAGEKTRQHLFDVVEFGGKASTVFSQKSIHLGLQVVCVTDQILDLLVAMILQPLYEGPMIELLSIASTKLGLRGQFWAWASSIDLKDRQS